MACSWWTTEWPIEPLSWWTRKGRSHTFRRELQPSIRLARTPRAAAWHIKISRTVVGQALSPANSEPARWQAKAPAPHPLPGTDLRQFQRQESPAFPANQRPLPGHVDRGGVALRASRGWVGSLRHWIGRQHSGKSPAGRRRHRFKGGAALRAYVVVTAVRRATVKHVARAATRARDG